MSDGTESIKFGWKSAKPEGSHRYLAPSVTKFLLQHVTKGSTILDVGCGNGSLTKVVAELGFETVGFDPASDGIAEARSAYPDLRFEIASAYDDLVSRFGQFNAVISCEVVEHLYDPALYAERIYQSLKPGGYAIISTPYHGYLKNIALAIAGKWDFHHHPLRLHGHVKFWSRETLSRLFINAKFRVIGIDRVGRFPALARSMVLCVQRIDR